MHRPPARPGGVQILDSDAKVVVTDPANLEKVKQFCLGRGLPIILLDPHTSSCSSNVDGTMSLSRLFQYDGSSYVPHTPISQDDVCALPYSSGTTGLPKGVKLTHRNLLANIIRTCFDDSEEQKDRDYVVLGLMPFFHIYGITGICCCTMRFTGTVVVMARFDLRSMLAAMVKYEVNFIPLVPPIILQLVKSSIVDEFDPALLKLEAVMTAAAPLAPELQTAFEAKFPGVEVRQVGCNKFTTCLYVPRDTFTL